jgi:alkanesulfonate monooxygenase SsuD/methylene tetrahydromethanopterin reductase-like flavin-dependent oxidoreductase (luciferase family)
VKLGVVILPCARWEQVRAHWVRADEWGLHAAYTYDHLSWRSFRDKPWFTMVPTLVAAASVTSSIRLGPMVTSPNFRHPLLLAKDLLALDDISLGRLVVGIGAGGTGFDAKVLGGEAWSTRERHERFEEFARALDRLLREPSSDLEGPYYRVVDSRQLPGPRQVPRPPLYFSALGPKSLALAAELADGWVSFGDPRAAADSSTFAAVRDQVRRLDEGIAARERDPASVWRVLLHFGGDEAPMDAFERFLDWAGRYRELGFDEVVIHWPERDSPFDYDLELFERICREGGPVLDSWSSPSSSPHSSPSPQPPPWASPSN